MADIPEYRRNTGITPAGSSGSFQAATAGVAKSHELMGDISSGLAQTASNEKARLDGIEAAKTPGRKLFPAFTQSDQAFVRSYKEEEYNSLIYNGHKYLNDSYELASKNPTASSLKSFQNGAQKALEGYVSQSQQDLAPGLKRALEQMYDSKYYQLANAVEARNKKNMTANFRHGFSVDMENVGNFHLQGMHEAATEAYSRNIGNINNALANDLITSDQAKEFKDAALIDNESKYMTYRAIENEKEGGGEGYDLLKFMADNRDEKLTPLQQLEVNKHVKSALDTRQSMLATQQQLDYTKAKSTLQSGNLTPAAMIDIQDQLSAQQFASFELEVAKYNAKAGQATNNLNSMLPNFGDAAAMSQYSNKQMDSVFEQILQQQKGNAERNGEEFKGSLIDQAMIAQDIKREVPSLVKKMDAAINFGSPEQALEAVRAYEMLKTNNEIGVQSIDPKTKSVGRLYSLYANNTSNTPEEALSRARGDVYGVSDDVRAERQENMKEYLKAKNLNTYQGKINHIAKSLGTKHWFGKNEIIPAGITTKYSELLYDMAGDTPLAEEADAMVMDELRKTYKKTNTNNRAEIMKIPPESVLPNVGNFIENDKARALKDFVDKNQAIRKSGGVTFNELSWDGAPDLTKDLIEDKLVDGDLIINIDGKKRKVVVVTDQVTERPADGSYSWAFNYILDDGRQAPLMDLYNPSASARWYPDTRYVKSRQERFEKEQMNKAMGTKKGQNFFQYFNKDVQSTLLEDIE